MEEARSPPVFGIRAVQSHDDRMGSGRWVFLSACARSALALTAAASLLAPLLSPLLGGDGTQRSTSDRACLPPNQSERTESVRSRCEGN